MDLSVPVYYPNPSGIQQMESYDPNAGPQGAPKEVKIDPTRYKTKLCRHFMDNGGVCPFQSRCVFSHGQAELRVGGPVAPQQPRIVPQYQDGTHPYATVSHQQKPQYYQPPPQPQHPSQYGHQVVQGHQPYYTVASVVQPAYYAPGQQSLSH